MQSSAGTYQNSSSLLVITTHHWNIIRARWLWQVRVDNNLFNQLDSYRNIYYSLRFFLQETKTGKAIPQPSRLKFIETFLTNNFALLDVEENTSVPLNRRSIAHFFAENTISNSSITTSNFLGRDRFFGFIIISKLSSFKKPFEKITSLSEFHLICRFILLVQMKEVVSMSYGSSTSSWKPWD